MGSSSVASDESFRARKLSILFFPFFSCSSCARLLAVVHDYHNNGSFVRRESLGLGAANSTQGLIIQSTLTSLPLRHTCLSPYISNERFEYTRCLSVRGLSSHVLLHLYRLSGSRTDHTQHFPKVHDFRSFSHTRANYPHFDADTPQQTLSTRSYVTSNAPKQSLRHHLFPCCTSLTQRRET